MSLGDTQVTFQGRDPKQVKRELLAYWHANRERLGLTLKEFLACCRLSGDGRRVVYKAQPGKPEVAVA